MTGNGDRTTVLDRGLVRVEAQPVDGRRVPYVFVQHIGCVITLPIIRDESNGPFVLTIDNDRRYYGMAHQILPGGNLDGDFESPENPRLAAVRELREETGHGYRDGASEDIDVFTLRTSTNDMIIDPQHFAVMRGVEYVGGEVNSPQEVITIRPTPLDEYAKALFRLERGELGPAINAGFAKAAMELGQDAVMGWLVGEDVPYATEVPRAFDPWLVPVAA
jgi:hypothetical protein